MNKQEPTNRLANVYTKNKFRTPAMAATFASSLKIGHYRVARIRNIWTKQPTPTATTTTTTTTTTTPFYFAS